MKNNPIIKEYAGQLADEQFSGLTIEAYIGYILRYYRWHDPGELILNPVVEREPFLLFKTYLLESKNLKPVTVNLYVSALKSFNDFLVETNRQSEIAIRSKDYMKIQTELSNPWDGEEEDVAHLLSTVQSSQLIFMKRDIAILTVMAYAGLRVSEAISLEVDDVRFSSYELFVRNGKGQKSRTVYIGEKVISATKDYLSVRPNTDCTTLFLGRSKKKLTRRRIQQIVSQHSDTLTPHKLRHFFCSQSQSVAGYSIMEASQQAGHRNPQTTMRYSHPRKKDILAKANRL